MSRPYAETIIYATVTAGIFLCYAMDAPRSEDALIPAVMFFILGSALPYVIRKWKKDEPE